MTPDLLLATAMDHHQAGRLREAQNLYRQVLQRVPRHPGALYLQGLIEIETRNYQRAADMIARSIRFNPDFPPAYCNLGIALAALKRPEEALAQYDAAIAGKPDFVEAYYNRGILLADLGRHEAAVASFTAALALRPDDVESLNNRGLALNALLRHDEAIGDFDTAIAAQPGFVAAHSNRGMALTWLNQPAEALASFDRALALRPDFAEAWCNRGDSLHDLDRPEDAVASFDKAIALRPDMAEAHFGRSLSLLTLGRYAEGFREQEWRHRRPGAPPARSFRQPLWLGDREIAGKTLFIYPELYLGDMVQFCRYAPLAAARGARVVLAAQRSLHGLVRSLGAEVVVIDERDVPPQFDLHCPLLSLPLAFGTVPETIPAVVPYLHAEPQLAAAWRRTLSNGGKKIGICWQGNASRQSLNRSFPLAALAPLARLPGVRLISLQAGFGLEQLASLPKGMRVEHFADTSDAGLPPFTTVAAMIAGLDLVITTDTVVAHVAAAMGRPTWVALKHVPDWRWGRRGDSTSWYPTARLFRQPKPGDWVSVFDAMAAALRSA